MHFLRALANCVATFVGLFCKIRNGENALAISFENALSDESLGTMRGLGFRDSRGFMIMIIAVQVLAEESFLENLVAYVPSSYTRVFLKHAKEELLFVDQHLRTFLSQYTLNALLETCEPAGSRTVADFIKSDVNVKVYPIHSFQMSVPSHVSQGRIVIVTEDGVLKRH